MRRLREEYARRPGVYVLVGDLAEETVYIGEADPVAVRLKQHLAKDLVMGRLLCRLSWLGKNRSLTFLNQNW